MNSTITKTKSFTFSFITSKKPEEVFSLLLDIKQWWSGLHRETIKGESRKIGDEFSFEAGGGAHYSKQKLIEMIPGRRVAWLVTESKLTFLNDTSEWNNTIIQFDLTASADNTKVTFTHEGLLPEIECYNGCSREWPKYLEKLKQKLM